MGKNINMKNILITGGAGFIGSNLALALLKMNYNITVLDNLSTQIHGVDPINTSPLFHSIANKVNFINGSVTSRNDLFLALQNQDAIVHLAAETGTGQSMYCIEKYVDVNIQGTALILDILSNNTIFKIKKFIISSSRSIYGEGKYFHQDLGIIYPEHRNETDMLNGDFEVKYNKISNLTLIATDENSTIHPSSVYGITKQTQEQLVMSVCPKIDISPISLRLQNVYGPGQSLSNPYTGILSIFSTQIRNNNPIQIFEDGKESRDFVFIDDVVKSFVLSLLNNRANGEIFNVGTGVATNVIEVAESLVNAYGINVPITITGKFRLGDIRHNYADINKISNILGYKVETDFNSGIKKFTTWVMKQKIVKDTLEESLNEMKNKGLLK
jgi:dTDP-L-rhamnose 4-epimerase